MTFRNMEELEQRLLALRLVKTQDIAECMSQMRGSHDPAELLRVMEGRGILTSYQTQSLLKGESEPLVLGDYKLLYKNAAGSFARVYRGCSRTTDEMIGLKLLRQRWAKDRQMVQQFHREAEVCKKLRHKNIVPIYDIGSEGQYHYLTMEFVEGGNLRDFLNVRKKLSPLEATQCVLDVAEGLAAALRLGVTHRDMKLTNVLMSSRGVAKLVDFGLAGDETGKGSGDESGQRALEYATLEKGTGAPPNDPRSDLYFLGAIFYELLTGTPPYPRTRSRDERKQLSRYTMIRPILNLEPNLPRSLSDIVERLMKANPSQRYQSPTEVIIDLRKALGELGRPMTGGNSDGAAESSKPTVLCMESRTKQQDMLRDYFSSRGFRVLMIGQTERAIARIGSQDPPNAVIFMAEAVGEDAVAAADQVSRSAEKAGIGCVIVLGDKQAPFPRSFKPRAGTSVMQQPITMRALRQELQKKMEARGVSFSPASDPAPTPTSSR